MENNIEEYINDFQFVDSKLGDDGLVVLSVQIEACFYFWNGHEVNVRRAIKECVQEYMSNFGEKIKWGFEPISWKPKKISQLVSFEEFLNAFQDPNDCIEWYVASGNADYPEEANEYALSIITSRQWEIQEGSVVTFRVDREDYENIAIKEKVNHLFNFFIHKLKPFHACMGLHSAPRYESDLVGIDIVEQLRTFNGLNIWNICDLSKLKYGFKSIDWYTYISKDLAEKIGGIQILESLVEKEKINHIKFSEGLLLIADKTPKLLPINKQIGGDYLKINNVLRPMRDGNYGSLGDATYLGEGFQSFDNYLTDLWIRRFDSYKIWPDSSTKIKARNVHSSDVSLLSGDVCLLHGRYRYENEYDDVRQRKVSFIDENNRDGDFRHYVILKSGDKAPFYLKMDKYGNLKEVEKIRWSLFEEFYY